MGAPLSPSVAEGTSALACLWAERKPLAESWRIAGISYWMPSVATTTVSAQGVLARYQEHLLH